MIRKFFKTLKMREQTLIIQGTIFLLVLILFTSIIYPFTTNGIQVIRESSYNALFRSNDARVSQISHQMKKLINLAFLQANMTLNKVQELYLHNYNSQFQISNCLQPFNSSGQYMMYCSDNQERINITSDYFFKFGNLLNEMDSWLLSLFLDQLLNLQLIFRIQSPHITSAFGITQFPKNFNVEKRPYYIDHLAQNNTRYIGNPFINQVSLKLSLIITQTIYDKNKNKDLIMGIGFQFDNLNKYLSLNNIKFILCTLKGVILASNLLNTQIIQTVTQITYIYEQSILPFTQDDWNQMINYVQNQSHESNCKQSFLKFCRNLDGKDVQIEASIVQDKFIQIMQTISLYRFNDLSFTESEQIILQNNIQVLLNYFTQQISVIIPFSFGILIISTFLLQQIIKPAAEMIQAIEQQIIQLLDNIQQVNKKIKKEDNLFNKLQNSYINFLIRHIDARNQKIYIINSFLFPSSHQVDKLDIDILLQLEDNQLEIQNINNKLTNQQLTMSKCDWNS